MLLNPATRKQLIREWREVQTDPERIERFRRHAMDMLIESFETSFACEDEYRALDDADREQYLRFVADDLAWALVRYVGFWVLNDFPQVEEWQQMRRRRGDRFARPEALPG